MSDHQTERLTATFLLGVMFEAAFPVEDAPPLSPDAALLVESIRERLGVLYQVLGETP